MALSPSRPRSAFTLIELLVVIAIIAVLIALLVPAVQKVRESANRAQCENNLKQLALGNHSYHDVNKMFPNGFLSNNPTNNGGVRMNWALWILPYIEQTNSYQQVMAQYNSGSFVLYAACSQIPISTFECPSDPLMGKMGGGPGADPLSSDGEGFHANYAACATGLGNTTTGGVTLTPNDGVIYPGSTTRISQITDGTSNTLLLSEHILVPDATAAQNTANSAQYWDTRGRMYNALNGAEMLFTSGLTPNTTVSDYLSRCNSFNPVAMAPCIVGGNAAGQEVMFARSYHPGGVNAALCDGSVRFVTNGISQSTFSAAGTKAGGETPGSDW